MTTAGRILPGAAGPFPQHGAAAWFATALTLSLCTAEPAVQRALQTAALAGLLPSLGLRTLIRNLTATWRTAGFGSAAFFGVLVTMSAFAVDPAVRDGFDTPKLYALLAASALLLLGYAALQLGRGTRVLRVSILELLLAAALAWGVVVNPRWVGGEGSLWFWVSLALVLVTFLTRQLVGSRDLDEPDATSRSPVRTRALGDFFTALWINGSALAVLGLRQAWDAGTFRYASGVEKTPMLSTIGSANGYGAFLAAGIIAAAVTGLRARTRFARVMLTGATLLQLGALLGNGSRGALLGLLTAALLTSWFRLLVGLPLRPRSDAARSAGPRRSRRRTAQVALSGLAVLLVLGLAALLLYRLNPDSGRGRLIAWEISANMTADHPFTGVGTGRFGAEHARYQAEIWRQPDHARWTHQAMRRTQPHSEYVHVLAERGLPGAILFVLLWVSAIGALLRYLARSGGGTALDWGLLALLVALPTHASVDQALHWPPVALTAHLALGLVPARALLRRPRSRALALGLLVVAAGYAGTVSAKLFREYPGYRQWREGLIVKGEPAVAALGAARARLPGEARLDLSLGAALLAQGRADSAIVHLDRGLADLDDYEIRLALAEAHLDRGELGMAAAHAGAAAASFPDRLLPQLVLARIHHAAGDTVRARAALARCTRRETHYRTAAVDRVAAEAARLWRSWYDDEPPR